MGQSVYFQSKHWEIISSPDKAARKTRLLGRTEHIYQAVGPYWAVGSVSFLMELR